MSLSASHLGFAHLKSFMSQARFKLSVTDEQCVDPDQIEQNLLDFLSNHKLTSFSKIIPAIKWIDYVHVFNGMARVTTNKANKI